MESMPQLVALLAVLATIQVLEHRHAHALPASLHL
jgi:hypothetical protein